MEKSTQLEKLNHLLIKHEQKWIYFIFVTLAVWVLWPTWFSDLSWDGYKYFVAADIPGSDTLEYWFHVFTTPNNRPQYRPVSFFVIPYLSKKIFGDNHALYPIFYWPLFLISLYYLVLLARSWKITWVGLIFSMTFFLRFHGHKSLLQDQSMGWKYYFPLLVLLIGVNKFGQSPLNLATALLWMLAMGISIMSHEGSVTFVPLLIFLFLFRQKKIMFGKTIFKKQWWALFLVTLPAWIYLFARVFVWKIPSEGFMSLDILQLPKVLIHFLGEAVRPMWIEWPIKDFKQEWHILGLIIFSILWISAFFVRTRNYFFAMFALFFVSFPFAILSGHVFSDRFIWATPFLTICLGLAFDRMWISLGKKLPFPKVYKLAVGALVLLFTLFFIYHKTRPFLYYEANLNFQEYRKSLVGKVRQRLSSTSDYLELRLPEIERYNFEDAFPGLLAKYFPNEKIYISKVADLGPIVIINGSYYKVTRLGWRDVYEFMHKPFENEISMKAYLDIQREDMRSVYKW